MRAGAPSARALRAAVTGVALTVLAAAPAAAQPDTEPPAPSGPGAYGFRGSLTYRNYSYFQGPANDDGTFENEGVLLVEWARRLAPWFSLRLGAEARGDTAGYADGVRFEIPDDDRHRSIVTLREAVASFRGGPLEVTAGKLFHAWGTADAFNPTDNLNPRDYMDPIDSEKMAVWSVAAQLTGGSMSATLVVVPVFTPSRLPLADSRWAPPPTPATALVNERDVPDPELSNVQFGARVKAALPGWDLSASYFEGFESTPVIRLSEIAVAPGFVAPVATPVFTRMRVLGLDFSTTWRKLEVHGETAFKFVARDGRHDRVQMVAGFNYTWDGFRLRWLDRIVAGAEYGKEINLATVDRSVLGTESLTRLGLALTNNALRDAAVGRVAVRFTEDTELRFTAVLDFTDTFSHWVQVRLTHRILDMLQAEAGVDLFTGQRGSSFWGQWSHNDRFAFSLKWFF